MRVLGLDIGSSSVKAGILQRKRLVGRAVRVPFPTRFDDQRAEVDPRVILRSLARAIAELRGAKSVDVIALSVMSPSWLAMDARGRAITPIITHQDRRSTSVANALLKRIGQRRLLSISGNLPFPGGISSSTWAWFVQQERQVMRRADLVGHLQTFIHRQMNGARVVDPSNASFMGLYETNSLRGWSDELCDAVGARQHQLPQIIEADGVAGMVNRAAGERFGLTHGTPMLVGCMDGSAAMLMSTMRPGQLLNVSGSTDVLAMLTGRARPHPRLLTRALGVGRLWMSVATIAAAGSSLEWVHANLFPDYSPRRFYRLAADVSHAASAGAVQFDPYLAGERTSIQQRSAAFKGLTLATTRQQMLRAVVTSLAAASAERIDLLRKTHRHLSRQVLLSGGTQGALERILHRDWPGTWKWRVEPEATLRGLAMLAER
jgi:xylulokinase